MSIATMKEPLISLRGDAARGLESSGSVVRNGGAAGVGLIRGVAVITTGVAVGHDLFIDKVFLQEVADAINAGGTKGVKSRFTHPSPSGDGLGHLLGRVKDARVVGDRVVGNLHLSKSSRNTPSGDLGGHILDLAEEDPDLFGSSIVFSRDEDAELAFVTDNQDRRGRFASPDRGNPQNFIHARLDELRAVDVVGEPAANPAGMFTVQTPAASVVRSADADDFDVERYRATGDPEAMIEFCERELRKHAAWVMAEIDKLHERVLGSDLEAKDRLRFR